jgi:PAS domain S-box-containing protein
LSAEPLLIALIVASLGLAWHVLRRPESGPASYWVAGWFSAGASGILLLVRQEFPNASFLAYPLGSLFPALLLAGACLRTARGIPGWLLPAALAFGAARAALVAAGHVELAFLASLAVEPAAVLLAGWLVWRARPRAGVSLAQRLLGPSFAVLAVVGAIHVAWVMHADSVAPGLLAMWVVAVPSLFGLQVFAEWERGRNFLQRAREELEARVEARTLELARVNASLRQEIGERRAVEQALRESEARYRVASELSSDLSFGFRTNARYRLSGGWVTDAFPRMTGYTMEELAGAKWLRMVHPDDLEAARRRFDEIAAGRERDLELRLLTRDGRTITVQAQVRVTRDERDGSLQVVGTARDVSEARRAQEERRRLERQVLEAQRLESLAMLTGGVAHDFNNLLAVILGNSRMAAAEAPPDAPLQTRLARIRAAAEHGARLTEQMLAYSGRSPVALKPLDVSRLVEETADLLEASVSERCRLELELSPRARVEGDATQLQQVLLNLVTNASEALGETAGSVWIRSGRIVQDASDLEGTVGSEHAAPGTYVFVEVSDAGPGMDAATQARIFEPFFTTKFSGRGLGLAAVLGIVRAHGGVMRVRSEPGAGTSVTMLLPEASAGAAAPEHAPAACATPRRSGTLLVIDDQGFVLEVAQAVLERAGHRVLTALGGRAGIETFRERSHEIEAVLLDLAMPDADGDTVLLELQRLRPDVRVIIATGYGAGQAAERMRGRGVAGFLRKPYEPEEILEQVDRALRAR